MESTDRRRARFRRPLPGQPATLRLRPGAPLDVEQFGTSRSGGVTAHELTYASPAGGRVPATLLVPDGTGLRPGIVLMHGLPSNRTEVLSWAERYTERSAVVILIDAPHARPGRAGANALLLTTQDRDEQIQLIQDLRRAVDLLISTPEVDPNRLGYVGLSYGAAIGGLLAGGRGSAARLCLARRRRRPPHPPHRS